MIKRLYSFFSVCGIFSLLMTGVVASDYHHKQSPRDQLCQANKLINEFNSGKITFEKAQKKCGGILEIVNLSGKVVHFGSANAMTPVPGALVSIAEYPVTKYLNITTDDAGLWTMPVVKIKRIPLKISFLYEKEGFQTAKSNILTVKSKNIDDIVMQFPDLQFFGGAKAMVEYQVGQKIGKSFPIDNVLVVTVGKSWASMFLDEFPHGDPGAVVTISPDIQYPSLGPVYFNEDVLPDLSFPFVSVDGGVLFANLPDGAYTFNALKDPYDFPSVEFEIEPDVHLYVASPPHGLQSSNSSAAGEW